MKLVVTDHAWASLAALTDYWAEFKTAERTDARVDELWKYVDWLLDHPTAGQFEVFLEALGKAHRRWIVKEVKIIYRFEGTTLYVTEFFDSRQDPRKMRG